MNIKKIREQFPMLKNDLIYLDSGALVQKPISVINAINDFYTKYSISNRTSDSKLGVLVSRKIEQVKKMSAQLLDATENEIILNSGTTDGLNYSAQILESLINENDEIIISSYNHSSHMIPWIELSKRTKANIIFTNDVLSSVNNKTKLICITQLNNTFNIPIDLENLKKRANEVGAIVINDAAQAISHEKVSSKYADIIAFSTNKFFGPTGLGVLFINKQVQEKIKSKKYGGGSVDTIKLNGDWTRKTSIIQHEPGTLNLAGIFGFYEALIFFQNLNLSDTQKYLKNLSIYCYDELSKIKNVNIHSKRGDSIILIDINNIPSQDVASYLGHKNIYVRSGFFCAKYLPNLIDKSLIRISLHIYNNKEDINTLVKTLKNGGDFLDFL